MLEILLQINIFATIKSKPMIKTRKIISLVTICLFLFSLTYTSCSPHRRGHTARQIGAGGKAKHHRTPASAKRKRSHKY